MVWRIFGGGKRNNPPPPTSRSGSSQPEDKDYSIGGATVHAEYKSLGDTNLAITGEGANEVYAVLQHKLSHDWESSVGYNQDENEIHVRSEHEVELEGLPKRPILNQNILHAALTGMQTALPDRLAIRAYLAEAQKDDSIQLARGNETFEAREDTRQEKAVKPYYDAAVAWLETQNIIIKDGALEALMERMKEAHKNRERGGI